MKKLLVDYFKIIIYTILIFGFIISSFYLLINYYYISEIKRKIYVGPNDSSYLSYQEKLTKIATNLTNFTAKNNHTAEEKLLYIEINNCHMVMQEAGTLGKIPVNTYFSNKDVYDLGSKFQSRVYNVCWAENLSSLLHVDNSSKFSNMVLPIKSSVELLNSQVQYALKELENNSSYFYSTNINAYTIRNYLDTDYNMIVSSYNGLADIVLYLSELLNGGNK